MRYRYADGFEFDANNAREVCEALWHSMHFQFYDTLEEWLRQNAEHCQRWNGKDYSADTAEAHVADLLLHGMLIELPAASTPLE